MERPINIFYVNADPRLAAQSLVDKHVVKMVLESAQLLSTAHRIMDGRQDGKLWVLPDSREPDLYRATHRNHPCAVWAREAVENYWWLFEHFDALLEEYTFRYDKHHKCEGLRYALQSPPYNTREFEGTPPALAMPDEFKTDDPVESYRNYYRVAKKDLHSWKRRSPPEWLIQTP